jgi:hypothetical protein
LDLLEPFDIHPEEEWAERIICEHPGIERIEHRTNGRGTADVVIKSEWMPFQRSAGGFAP